MKKGIPKKNKDMKFRDQEKNPTLPNLDWEFPGVAE
jgi:hypothetical protein